LRVTAKTETPQNKKPTKTNSTAHVNPQRSTSFFRAGATSPKEYAPDASDQSNHNAETFGQSDSKQTLPK